MSDLGFGNEILEPLPDFTVPTDVSVEEKLPEFNPKASEDLEGLLYLGMISWTFVWQGHKFVIKTLNENERLHAALLAKPWIGTAEEARAWIMATVGMAIVSVDGKAIVSLGIDDMSIADSKFEWAKKQFPWTIDVIMKEFATLESRVEAALDVMGKD